MNKNIFLALILFTTTTQTLPILTPQRSGNNPVNSPTYWQIFITLIYGNPQPQENPDQAPIGVSVDNYIAQVRSDLNGQTSRYAPLIPLNEMQEIEAAMKINLCSTDTKDIANNKIRSILIAQVGKGTLKDLYELANKERFYVSEEEYITIPASYENNARVTLEKTPHNLNGEAIAPYYGENRKNSVRHDLMNRNNYR